MEASTKENELINFESLHGIFGGLRLARRFVTQKRLESLFQTVGGVIVLDAADSEEVEPDSNGTYPQLRTDAKYLVADEQQLQALDDEGTDGQPPVHPCPSLCRKLCAHHHAHGVGSVVHTGGHDAAASGDEAGAPGADPRALHAAPSAPLHLLRGTCRIPCQAVPTCGATAALACGHQL